MLPISVEQYTEFRENAYLNVHLKDIEVILLAYT